MIFQARPQKRRFQTRDRRIRNHFARSQSLRKHFVKERLRDDRLARHHAFPHLLLPTQTPARRSSQAQLQVQRPPWTQLRTRPPSQAHPLTQQPSRAQLPLPAFRSSCRTLHHGEASCRISCNTCLTLHLDSLLLLGIVSPGVSDACNGRTMRACLHDFFTRFIPLFRNTPFDYSCIVETIPNEKRGHVLQPLRNRKREHSEVLPPMRKRAPSKRAIE